MTNQTDPHTGSLSCVFLSPGTFFAEQTVVPVDRQDIAWAANHAKTVTERYNAKPYGFYFRREEPNRSHRSSGIYYLTGRIFTYDEVPDTKENEILRSNMRHNCPVAIENNNSYRSTSPFNADDILVSETGQILRMGDEPALMQYRQKIEEQVRNSAV